MGEELLRKRLHIRVGGIPKHLEITHEELEAIQKEAADKIIDLLLSRVRQATPESS